MRNSKNMTILLVLGIMILLLSSCGSSKVTCPSCGKQVDELITDKVDSGMEYSWCASCWADYRGIKGAGTVTEAPMESEPTATPEPTKVPENIPVKFEEDGRYGIKFDGKTIADSIWQNIEIFKFNNAYYYLVELNDKTGLMDENGELIVEPAWEVSHSYSSDYKGFTKTQYNFLDQGYIVVPCEGKNIFCCVKDGQYVETPSGLLDYLDGNLLVFVSTIYDPTVKNENVRKSKLSVYNLATNQSSWEMESKGGTDREKDLKLTTVLGRKANLSDEELKEWRKKNGYVITKCGDKGIILNYNSSHYAYFGQDGKTISGYTGSHFNYYDCNMLRDIRSDFLETENTVTLYDLDNDGEVFFSSAVYKSRKDVPSAQKVDNQYLMVIAEAQSEKSEEKGPLFLLNMTNRTITPLSEEIEKVMEFSDGMAAVQNTEGKWGYINAKGELVYPCEYDEGNPFEDGKVVTIRNYKKVTLTKDGPGQ